MSKKDKKSNTSLAKTESNRKNALKSTGPKTRTGKEIVKWNALKHGLLAREVAVNSEHGNECLCEFDALLDALHADLQPVGMIEEMLVEKMAVCYWRQRRAIRCENGEILKMVDNAVWEWAFKLKDDFQHTKLFIGLGSSHEKLRRSSMGLNYLIGLLKDVRTEIESNDGLSEESIQKLLDHLGHDKGGLAFNIGLFHHMATRGQQMAKDDPEKYGDTPSPETCQKIMLDLIDTELKTMEEFSEAFRDKEKNELEATKLSMALPEKIILDKNLRYETTIERQFYKALHELIRLQSARKGNNPPAPIAIDVDISNDN